jgi:hypothetical protein
MEIFGGVFTEHGIFQPAPRANFSFDEHKYNPNINICRAARGAV